jgi:hypothetical protein
VGFFHTHTAQRERERERESTSDDFVGAFDGVRVEVLLARFGLGHEWCGWEA